MAYSTQTLVSKITSIISSTCCTMMIMRLPFKTPPVMIAMLLFCFCSLSQTVLVGKDLLKNEDKK